jgi:hypothetical protein
VLPSDTVIAVAKDHGRDCLSHSDALIGWWPARVGIRASLPIQFRPPLMAFSMTTVQRIKVDRLSRTVREDGTKSRIAVSFSMLFEEVLELWD